MRGLLLLLQHFRYKGHHHHRTLVTYGLTSPLYHWFCLVVKCDNLYYHKNLIITIIKLNVPDFKLYIFYIFIDIIYLLKCSYVYGHILQKMVLLWFSYIKYICVCVGYFCRRVSFGHRGLQ